MLTRHRLDALLVQRGLARSRARAVELIRAGIVDIDGIRVRKPAALVREDAAITLTGPAQRAEYVSRGGEKLARALSAFAPLGLDVAGRRCLDAGASTGGFTQALLDAGAASVVAVDVGHRQLVERLRCDARVRVLEGKNVRTLGLADIGGAVDVAVADLSFISLTLVLEALRGVSQPDADYVALVKPQFEVGRARLRRSGVVRDPLDRAGALRSVGATAQRLRLGVVAGMVSVPPGEAGNLEYFLWMRRGAPPLAEHTVVQLVAEPPGSGRVVG